MPELKEILAPLREYIGDDAEKKQEVADALHSEFSGVAQVLIDKGAGLGKGELKKQVKAVEKERNEAKERVTELEGELEDARNKAPDTEKKIGELRDQHKAALKKKDEELQAERDGRRGDKRATAVERFLKKLKPGVEVDEDYANSVIAAKYADRFSIADDGTLEIKQLGTDAVYAPADGKDAVDLLAADVLKAVPPKFRLTGVEGGGGQGGGGGSPISKDKAVTSQFQKQRDAVPNPLLPQPTTTAAAK